MHRRYVVVLFALVLAALQGCASLQGRDPLQVTVAGIEPLEGQGMELRLLVKLRVQNPNDSPVTYNGVALQMDVQSKTFASGVSDESDANTFYAYFLLSHRVNAAITQTIAACHE